VGVSRLSEANWNQLQIISLGNDNRIKLEIVLATRDANIYQKLRQKNLREYIFVVIKLTIDNC
jgi:hypothetical protein